MALRRSALFVGLGLGLALWPAPTRAESPVDAPGAGPGQRLYLPYAATLIAEPCGPAIPESCPGGADWTAVCGGMGRIRDLFALGDAAGTVIAVGDGAARWRAGAGPADASEDTSARGLGPGSGWTAQIGQELTGLKAAYIPEEAAGAFGWAAGDQGQTPELRDGCWRAHPPQQRVYLDVELLSIRIMPFNGERIGWAVGRSRSDRAVALELKPDGWADHDYVAHLVPMLTDVAFEPHPSAFGEPPRAWAVGANLERPEGVFARIGNNGLWSIRQTDASGWPRELILGQDNNQGWAFGERWDGSAVLAWAWDPEDLLWKLDRGAPVDAWEGHALVDAYQVPGTEIWVGISPRSGREILHRFDGATGEWSAYGVSPFAEDDLGIDGSSAIAAVPAGAPGAREGLLYAWGEQVWWYDRAGDAWQRVRERHRFVDFDPLDEAGWLLARAAQGSGLFTRQGDRIYPGAALDAELAQALAAAPMNALARGGGELWMVGERGTSVRMRGPLGRPELFRLPAADPPRFVDVAVSPAGEAWAITVDEAPANGDPPATDAAPSAGEAPAADEAPAHRLWWFDTAAGAWREQPLGPATSDGRWKALTVTAAGEVWVAGEGESLSISAGCKPVAPAGMAGSGAGLGSSSCAGTKPTCWCDADGTGRAICRHPNPPVAPDAVAISALPAGPVWIAGPQAIARNAGQGWCAEPALVGAGGENLLRSGARLVKIAVAAADDIWAVAHCGREPRFSDRIACGDGEPTTSTVLHFDGRAWSEATTVNVAIHDVDVTSGPGTRTVWLTGDWSTLIRHSYPVSSDRSAAD